MFTLTVKFSDESVVNGTATFETGCIFLSPLSAYICMPSGSTNYAQNIF
jgi:hypothetical protein